jgi:hypothetical protein
LRQQSKGERKIDIKEIAGHSKKEGKDGGR